MEQLKTIAVNAALIALVSLALFWGNTLHRQQVQYDKGEKGLKAGDFLTAVAGYESAIHMYTPGSGTVERAAQRLWELGELAAQKGDVPRALIAFRALRSAFYADAGLFSPGQEWIRKCDERIAGLVKLQLQSRP